MFNKSEIRLWSLGCTLTTPNLTYSDTDIKTHNLIST